MSVDPGLYARLKPLLDMPTAPDRHGRIWSYCPAHGDGKKHGKKGGAGNGRSLSLHPSMGVQCFSGCSFTDIIKALEANSNVRTMPGRDNNRPNSRDRVPAKAPADQPRRGGIPDGAKLVETYEYKDPVTGRVLALKGRYEWPDLNPKGYDKAFSWWLPGQPERSGLKGLAVGDLPLWGADLVLAADPDRIVWFCEGEKATTALRARNELAVCLSQGSSAKEFGDSLDVLEDRKVRLWPDNDSAGQGAGLMARLSLALQPIARTVEIVQPPAWLGEHGDAFEFFQGNGNLAELPIKAVTGITVVPNGDDAFTVQVLTETGVWAHFEFAEMAFSGGRTLDASLSISLRGKGMERTPYKQRVNLRSGSQRSSLETALNKQFKSAGVNWTIAISKAWDAAETAFRAGRKPVALDEDEDDMETFLIPELLPEGVPTILFGDGSAGKSYIAGGMVAAVSIGDYFAGYPAQQRNVLYCDWETNAKTWKRRMRRVYRGMNIDPAIGEGLPIRYWNAVGQPLVECIDQIRAIVREHDIGLVVIDSGGFACGGPPEETKPAIDFFNAISRIQATTLILCHVSKEALNKPTPPDRPFGSQYWHNGARRTWYVARAAEPGSDEIDIGLYCKKVNDGPMPKGIGLDMVFEGSNGPVQFFSKDIALTAFATMHQSDRERVLEYLSASPMTKRSTKDIAEALGMTARNTYQLLQRFPDTFVGLTNAPAGRPDQQWGIRARESA